MQISLTWLRIVQSYLTRLVPTPCIFLQPVRVNLARNISESRLRVKWGSLTLVILPDISDYDKLCTCSSGHGLFEMMMLQMGCIKIIKVVYCWRSVYTRRDIAARCCGAIDVENGLQKINRVVYIRGDVAGSHYDAPPEMAAAPILSCQLAISPQILMALSKRVVDIARETSSNYCYTMATSCLVWTVWEYLMPMLCIGVNYHSSWSLSRSA